MKAMQTVKIELLQGDNSPLVFSTEISESAKLSKISGTLAFRIILLFQKAKKYRMNLGGFSFARKFDVRITVQGVCASGTEIVGKDVIKFGITLQANENSVERFHDFIKDLVIDILTGESQMEGDFADLKPELCLN